MPRKFAKIMYLDELSHANEGDSFVCINDGSLFGRKVIIEGFMNVVWADSKESLDVDPFAKHYTFISAKWAS